jgi:hypothetical protein
MSETVDQLSELYLNPDFSYQLSAYPCALTAEQKSDYHQLISELIATLDKLDNQLERAVYYTGMFDVEAVADDQTSFFNVIVWISEARNWLSDIRPVLISCLPITRHSAPAITDEPSVIVPLHEGADQEGKNSSTSSRRETKEAALIEWFEEPRKYPIVMGLLVEKGFCQLGTYIWIDDTPGAKTAVAILIKHIHAQGFFIDNVKPSNSEVLYIAKHTFGVDVRIDTVKRAKAIMSTYYNFSFIGPASTY